VKIPAAHIEPEMKARERDAAFHELLSRLVDAGAITRDAEPSIIAGLIAREETMSTGVGFGFAFPQTQSAFVSRPVLAFGRSWPGIEFNSLDGRPVKAVFLFIYPPGGDVRQIRVRHRADRIDPSLYENAPKTMWDCSTADEMAQLLNRTMFDDDEPPA
jgi:mannitol/fructose-specific phosphotransferase system IIA component (Ntr-type)